MEQLTLEEEFARAAFKQQIESISYSESQELLSQLQHSVKAQKTFLEQMLKTELPLIIVIAYDYKELLIKYHAVWQKQNKMLKTIFLEGLAELKSEKFSG
jgi:hypothetical protein